MNTTQSGQPVGSDEARWEDLETRQADLLDLRYQRDVGLPFSADEINRCGAAVRDLALQMVPDYRDDPEARGLLSRLSQASTALSLGVAHQAIRDRVLTKTGFSDGGDVLTPYNVHQFLRCEPDAEKRSRILRHICQPNAEIDTADDARRAAQWTIARQVGMTPLEEFVDSEGMSVESLRQLLLGLGDRLGEKASDILVKRRAIHFPEMSGPPTWEQAVAVGLRGDGRASLATASELDSIDGLAKVLETAAKMGFPAERVYVDLVDRPKKYPGATAYRIRIPTDVRIRVKPLGDKLRDTSVLYHEMGHALHFISVNPDLPLPARIGFNFATSETFSFWLESLWMSRLYLEDEMGLSTELASNTVLAAHEGFLSSAVGISAAALAIVDYWSRDSPSTLEEIESSLTGYLRRFFGYSLPEGAIRWYSSTVLALEMNTLGYPVALVRLGHLLDRLEAGRTDWWASKDSIQPIRDLMASGRRAAFSSSMLDTSPFIRRVVSAVER